MLLEEKTEADLKPNQTPAPEIVKPAITPEKDPEPELQKEEVLTGEPILEKGQIVA